MRGSIYGFRSATLSAFLLFGGWLAFGLFAYIIRYSLEKAVSLPVFPLIWEYLIPPILVGGPLAVFDANMLRSWVRQFPFLVSVMVRLLIIGVTIIITYALIGYFLLDYRGDTLRYYVQYFLMLWGTGSMLLLAIRNLAEHFDRRQLYFWITGAYHRPRVEERIFLFIDLNDSTSIAERLGHEKYFDFLASYFSLTAGIIEDHFGEIYQHVGDEIIVTWPIAQGLKDHRALSLIYRIREAIADREEEFISKYGVSPQIKGSLHAGMVTKGEIIGKRREFIFTGDVLNVTARMQALCKPNEALLIISDDLLKRMDLPVGHCAESLGTHRLRGRELSMEVHSIDRC